MRLIACSIVALFCLGFSISGGRAAPDLAPPSERADFVFVDKSERVLILQRDGAAIARYRIDLGFSPEGHKTQQGDGKTPEGRYAITWRNPESAFHLSLFINYPNAADRAQAAARGVDPGGDIFIHGGSWAAGALRRDWTLGCIAVTDAEMAEIWALVPNGTPIEIAP